MQPIQSVVMESISGVRGYGPEFSDRVVSFAESYATGYTRAIVLGRDTRAGGKQLEETLGRLYKAMGIDVVNLGIAPTPTIQLIAQDFEVWGNGSTASHNPHPWLGVKFFRENGILNASELEEIQARRGVNGFPNRGIGSYIDPKDLVGNSFETVTGNVAFDYHVSRVFSALGEGVIDTIRSKQYKVLVDHVQGAGYDVVPKLLSYLGCIVESVHPDTYNGFLARPDPEPTPENLTEFASRMRSGYFDVGFAVDPDVDRLVLGSHQGCLSEEYSVSLALQFMADTHGKDHNTVVTTATSRMTRDVAEKNKWKFTRTPVGERNVLDEMTRAKTIVGGEGNGGIIYPSVAPGRDAVFGIVMTLAYMAQTDEHLDGLLSDIPNYFREKILSDSLQFDDAVHRLDQKYGSETIDRRDGWRVSLPEGWLLVRESNTEPKVRVMAEATTQEFLEKLISDAFH